MLLVGERQKIVAVDEVRSHRLEIVDLWESSKATYCQNLKSNMKKACLVSSKKCSKGFRAVRFSVLFTLIASFTFRSACFGRVYRRLHSIITLTSVNIITYLPNSLSSQDFFCSCCKVIFRRLFSSVAALYFAFNSASSATVWASTAALAALSSAVALIASAVC